MDTTKASVLEGRMAFGQAFLLQFHGVAIIVYPDESLGNALGQPEWMSKNIERSAQQCAEKLKGADYAICFAWLDKADFIADLWTFSGCQTWGSGPLADVSIVREGKVDTSSGVGSGNSLVVLGIEEQYRRMSASTEVYLSSPRPELPPELALARV